MFWGDFAGNRPRKQKNRPKTAQIARNGRKLGQIDEKNARNLKKALAGRENGARIEFFKILGQNVKNRPANPENQPENFAKFCQNLPNFAKI